MVGFEIVIFLICVLAIYLNYVTTIAFTLAEAIFIFVVYEVIFNFALWFWINKIVVL